MNILEMLKGGDLRSIGRANEVAELVCSKPALLKKLVQGIYSDDPIVRARSADVLEKVSSQVPEHLEFLKKDLLGRIAKIEQQEIRWHVALILPRLSLSTHEQTEAKKLFLRWLDTDKSNIVKVSSLQGLFELSRINPKLRASVRSKLGDLVLNGSPSLRARSRKLLKIIEKTHF